MKKIITIFAVMALSTVSAKAVDFSVFSLTAGFGTNQSVFGGTAKETKFHEAGSEKGTTAKSSGVFTDDFSSQFIELGVGKYLSFGFHHVPDSISTPENINTGKGGSDTSKVSVDFNDLNTTYAKFNVPGGMYIKYGWLETDLDIRETQLSGNTYKNQSTEGTSWGAGFERTLGETNFALRLEANYLDMDNMTANNGISASGGAAGTGGRNLVSASNLEGLTGSVFLTYTFGRNE